MTGLDDTDTFQIFLFFLGCLQFGFYLPAAPTFLSFSAAKNNQERNRQRAEDGQAHTPIKEHHTDADQSAGNGVRHQRRHNMAHGVFNAGTVAHHISGQFRQVFVIEHTHGEFADQFCNANTGIFRRCIARHIGFPIIIFATEEVDNYGNTTSAKQNPHLTPRNCTAGQRLQNLQKNLNCDDNRQHQGEVGKGAGKDALFQILCSPI